MSQFEISLLQPTVLRGIIERMQPRQEHVLLNSIPQTRNPFPTVSWEITRGSRNIAQPNVPNSEAHIVDRQGRSRAAAAFVYLREKKVFTPTTIHWLRQAANGLNDLAKTNAEEAVTREIRDLNDRFDNFAEYMLWQALTGTLTFDFSDVQASVDYQFSATHKPTTTTKWDAATPSQIMADVRSWKSLLQRDGQVAPTVAYTSENVVDAIFDAWVAAGSSAPGALVSDRMKDEYYGTGTLPNFMGLNWKIQDAVYDAAGASYRGESDPASETRFLAEGDVVFANLTDNRPVELVVGPSADDDAPSGFTGKFAKSWKEQDPSARQYLLEWNILPVVTRPDQIVYAADVIS